ncbi:hypothetical protein [Novosphingobium lindaniclasticum]|uniref:Uncharacterized protein n=1 Tax=Novosphingobium lindaniclasticum LE124 TaxID=1096930 RepID=T0I5D9_9SPHN|nr:hypothetical protein [Novosphingobium lindaniclasticum]EQB19578.1 hypothetical protein L284_01315 [Novosphingobium lindaniclasticum LE124]
METTFMLHGETAVELHDMGEGSLVLCQKNETGELEQVALDWEQLLLAVQALSPRYGHDLAKNTDQSSQGMREAA